MECAAQKMIKSFTIHLLIKKYKLTYNKTKDNQPHHYLINNIIGP